MTARRGASLVELLLVIALIAALTALSVPALSRQESPNSTTLLLREIAAARSHAVVTGRPHTIAVTWKEKLHLLTVLPDGRTVADPIIPIDPYSGAGRSAP